MSDRDVMQQALEALERARPQIRGVLPSQDADAAIEALRARLAEPEPEPVAWMDIDSDGNRLSVRQWSDGNRDEVPLYTAPPTRSPLTDEEIDALDTDKDGLPNSHLEFARAIERKITGGNDE